MIFNYILSVSIFENKLWHEYDPQTMTYSKEDATLEILIMLAIAFILGFLLRHFLGYIAKKEIIHEYSSEESSSGNELESLRTDNEKLKKDLAACLHSYNDLKSSGSASTSKSLKAAEVSAEKSVKTKKTTPPKAKSTKNKIASSDNKSSNKDDLKVIEGIGPALEKLLNDNGIFSYAELAGSNVAALDKILDDAGPRFRVHVPETWTEQAVLLRDGKVDEFNKLTEKLKGGRRRK